MTRSMLLLAFSCLVAIISNAQHVSARAVYYGFSSYNAYRQIVGVIDSSAPQCTCTQPKHSIRSQTRQHSETTNLCQSTHTRTQTHSNHRARSPPLASSKLSTQPQPGNTLLVEFDIAVSEHLVTPSVVSAEETAKLGDLVANNPILDTVIDVATVVSEQEAPTSSDNVKKESDEQPEKLTSLPYSSTNGLRIHSSVIVMEVPCESDDNEALPANAPLAIFLPGTGVPTGYYERLREPLRKLGVRMASVEARGVGESSLRAGWKEDWSYGDLIEEDYPAAISVCRDHAPNASVVFALAHSMGGQLAILAAAHGRLNVDGIITVMTASLHREVIGSTAVERMILAAALATMHGISRVLGYWPGDLVGAFGRLPRTYVCRDFFKQFDTNAWYSEYQGESIEFEQDMLNLSIPVAMLHFTHGDWIATAATVADMAEKVGPNGATVHALDDKRIKNTHIGWVKHSDTVMEVVEQFVIQLLEEKA